ncbi:MAG: 4Fe-4S dicluster domain-containing protein [Thermoproteota archaeon]|nr:4Fe-4S dicluster domain-containing protein [Thermoproteota archaeon]
MPMKHRKTENKQQLIIERIHHTKRYKLILNKNLCQPCQLCALICPKQAIHTETQPKIEGKTQKPLIDIDENLCHYCGICQAICPYGAIQIQINGQPFNAVFEKESFPQLIREIQVDTTKCPLDCHECEKACPLNLIKVTLHSSQVKVDIKKLQCPACRICEIKCPKDAIKVRRIFYGKLKINPEKCPEGCRDCLDVCPITGALYWSEDDKKVHVNELFCVYCGTCQLVCPEPEALELQRTKILHTPVRSGAWNKAFEKLTSTKEMTKELEAKGFSKAKESVEKLLAWRAK